MHSYLKEISKNMLVSLLAVVAEFHEPSVTDYTLDKGETLVSFFGVGCVCASSRENIHRFVSDSKAKLMRTKYLHTI